MQLFGYFGEPDAAAGLQGRARTSIRRSRSWCAPSRAIPIDLAKFDFELVTPEPVVRACTLEIKGQA